MVFVLLCCFFFVLVIILQILILKHTLQLNYYFQVDASHCCSHVSHLQFKLEALIKYEVYYLHPKHSFHVIQPGLSIEPDFHLHGLTCTENAGMDIQSKYKLHTTPNHLGKRNL